MNNLDKVVYNYENNPSSFNNISKKEIKKRIEKVTVLKSQFESLTVEYKQIEATTMGLQTQASGSELTEYQRGLDGEYD